MLTRTHTYEPHETTHDIPLLLSDEAKTEIDSKWFYLYKWISSTEVKASIQRDYLHILSRFGIWIGLIAILWGLLGWGGVLGFFFFFSVLGFFYFFIFLYLIILAIRRALLLTNTANVVLTDKAISFWWDIIPYHDLPHYQKKIEKWEKEFDEPLFGNSGIEEKRKSLFKDVIESIGKWWKWAFDFFDNIRIDRWWGQLIFLALIFGLVYSASTAVVYFAGLFFVWIFSLWITILNRIILRLIGQKVQRIHDWFTTIDSFANQLKKTNSDLREALKNAQAHEWKDALLPRINENIKRVNSLADNSLTSSQKLKNILQNSEYKNIFNFDRYHGWIRTQIIIPLRDIRDLLSQNHLLVSTTIDSIDQEIEKIQLSKENAMLPKERAIATLEIQKERLRIQLGEFEKYGTRIDEYLTKLGE